MSDGDHALIPVANLVRKRRIRTSPRKRGAPRKRTVSVKRITREKLAAGWVDAGGRPHPGELGSRPRTWRDCRHARPCPYVACKHHLYLDINPETGAIIFNFPDIEPHDMKVSCALDVSGLGGQTLDQVGDLMNLSRERIRQLEIRILWKLRWLQRVREFGVDGPLG